MSQQALIAAMEKEAKRIGATLSTTNSSSHYKITGDMVVNYYPFSAKRTAFIEGTKKGVSGVSPEAAVQMCMTNQQDYE